MTTDQPTTNDTNGSIIRGIVKSARPHQWVKNVFVLAPLFFSKSFQDPTLLAIGLVAGLLFCFVSSSVYLLNDIFDVEKDRNHPTKKNRPIASGVLPIPMAWMASATLAGGSMIAAAFIDWRFCATLVGYFAMNFAYSMVLKHVPFVDVGIIATGFVLRVLSGAFAIDVFMSEWLFGCTFLLALYLGLGKRQHELTMMLAGRAKKSRKVLERYHPEQLEFMFLFIAGMTIACYTVYTLTASLPNQPLRTELTPVSSPYLPITIPFTVFGITRFYQLVNKDSDHSPTDLLLRDWPFLANILCWCAVMFYVVFL